MNQKMQITYLAHQHITPEIKKWLDEQKAIGQSKRTIFKAMLHAGWKSSVAAQAMQLTDAEVIAFNRPEQTLALGHSAYSLSSYTLSNVSAAPKLLTVPIPALNSTGDKVDGGDKWVEVFQHRKKSPEIMVFADLLSSEECDALVEAARPRLSRSLTVDTKTGGEELHADRTSQGMFFRRGENPLVQQVEARIAKLLNWPLANGEALQVLRYPPGAEYKPHYDYFDPVEPGTPTILKRGGQRVATLIIYLFEPLEGGETVFPDVDFKVAPKRGNAVFFSYSQPHPMSKSLHGGAPVKEGEKWIATKWLREREFN